jgi:hypothetical protein
MATNPPISNKKNDVKITAKSCFFIIRVSKIQELKIQILRK